MYKLKKQKKKKKMLILCRVIKFMCQDFCDCFIASLGALITGGITPFCGWVLSKTVNALSSTNRHKVFDDGLKWAFIFLRLLLLQFQFLFLLNYGNLKN